MAHLLHPVHLAGPCTAHLIGHGFRRAAFRSDKAFTTASTCNALCFTVRITSGALLFFAAYVNISSFPCSVLQQSVDFDLLCRNHFHYVSNDVEDLSRPRTSSSRRNQVGLPITGMPPVPSAADRAVIIKGVGAHSPHNLFRLGDNVCPPCSHSRRSTVRLRCLYRLGYEYNPHGMIPADQTFFSARSTEHHGAVVKFTTTVHMEV